MITAADLAAIRLTLELAATTTAILLVVGTPVAWWLARTGSRWKAVVGAVVALPLVLPPTVIGFYLLVALGPHGPVGQLTQALGLGLLPFTFAGLVVGSVFYSLPFVVQSLQNAFEAIGERPLEVAATLRAGAIDTFFSVVLPLARPGFVTATILGFAHTVGEFGVVLMIGGNIPDKTRVVSVQIYDHVEALEYAEAHWLSAGMLVFSFVVLLALYGQKKGAVR
ncbi:molybdate ABC transporter permease subunit [Aromatoleum bremense]|uniref:Molybdenum transport system permease n=1 Tax=Aromatoleum bremense TaxID=76115 RepID=A0ABX1NYA3_9RHOO|nr:molybdate ABC transporter permease subunit [Aromatoleum bremense]NMG16932.1 molybdate ABC transporter permease subunit [Aromatoleum bremense]QTQ31697.1 Molybdenum transport system, permease protein [Aromatoleum bremense]